MQLLNASGTSKLVESIAAGSNFKRVQCFKIRTGPMRTTLSAGGSKLDQAKPVNGIDNSERWKLLEGEGGSKNPRSAAASKASSCARLLKRDGDPKLTQSATSGKNRKLNRATPDTSGMKTE